MADRAAVRDMAIIGMNCDIIILYFSAHTLEYSYKCINWE